LKPSILTATVFGVGYSPVAPGTAGSLAGLLVYLPLRWVGSPALELAAIVVVFVAGALAATAAEEHFGHIDPGPVVIDEVLGMLVTLALLPVSITGALVGFVLFRIFDVVKPPPSRQLEALQGGWGVMADDLMAAIYGHLVLRGLAWLWPGWLLV
jgi:phosphatidylglycerophosphatase A